jgi:hypothetical protein
MFMLFLLEIVEPLLEFIFMAYATYFTGRLRAARYYFLLSTPCEW